MNVLNINYEVSTWIKESNMEKFCLQEIKSLEVKLDVK